MIGAIASHFVDAAPPPSGPTPRVLLRAADITGLNDGDPVATWTDSSGNGYHATQGTAANRPLYRAGGGSPYLEFDGVDDWLSIPYSFAGGQAATIFVRLHSTEAGGTYRNVFDGPTPTSNPMVWFDTTGKVEFNQGAGRSGSAHRNVWATVAITHGAGSVAPTFYVNGGTVAGGSAYSMPSYTPQWFHRSFANTWKGYVSEVRIYDVALSAAEVAAL